GANRIGDLVKACQADGQGALALTDHGNMYGAIELYKKCTEGGIKPLVGCEVYIAKQSMHQSHSKRKGNGYSHLTLLARNEEGYKNLMKLSSEAFVNGYSFRPRIDMDLLAQHAAGISCLSGCLAGEINQLFLQDKESEAQALAGRLRDLFGPEHFWLELQRNGIEIQTKANESLYRLHQATGIPLVATNDIHYLRAEDCHTQDILLCINTGAKRSDEKRFRFDTESLYFKTREEMAHMFRDLPDSLQATMDVAEQVNLEIEFGKYHMPEFVSETGESANDLLDRLLAERLPKLYPGDNHQARERLHHEVQVIKELGFVSYFLIVWDLIRWARQNHIPVGPGRGSAAGSIVAYLLDITRVDPLKYDLLFERFLNSSRVSMPDIDIDFCKDGREAVIEYTRQKYGRDSVTQIVTFGTMASRTVVRDVGRVLDIPLREIDKIAKKIPSGPGAPTLGKALESDAELQAFRNLGPEYEELFNFSVPLEGMARHVSTHAAGVVITPRPTHEFVPLGRNGEDITTQYSAPQLEELGLLKMDYLGLRTLTIIEKTLRNIEKMGGTPPDIENLPEGDPATYQMLMQGDTLGVFQLESEGMRKLLARLKPDCFEDIAAVLALYRPGPLESGMVDMFVDRKHGREAIQYPHPSVEKILKGTYGCLVYQEQIMLASVELGGFSLNDADNLRKAMGKKKPEIMQKFSAQFLEGAERNGASRETAQEVWDIILKFGGYGFNKSHTAAYAVITYQTAYLKANYRTAFLAANFSCEMGDSDKVKNFLDDSRKANVRIVPPGISHAVWDFEALEEGVIGFGLGAIKGMGKRAADTLIAARDRVLAQDKPLTLHTLAGEADPAQVGKLAWEAIIKAGCFDETGHNRGAVLAALDGALADGSVAADARKTGQMSMFDMFGGAEADASDPSAPAADGIDDSKALSDMDSLALEYEVLGFYLTGHPLQEKAGMVSLLSSSPIPAFANLPGGSEVRVAGLVLQKAELVVKTGRMAGQKMCRFRLEDLHGSIAATVFPRTYEEHRDAIEDGQVILCIAKLEDSGEEPALIVDRIMPLASALEVFQGGLSIQLDPRDETHLERLQGVLDKHRGERPLFFQVTGDDGRLRRVRTPKAGVNINEGLAQELIELLGEGRVGLVRI
ncbi:MAG: DNA polymerase III subunit alpha, partial [Planctomycetes bacterium]|nr:DNA polymerase III subunit alpha [Planctomycetota bacterium]